MSRKEPNQHTDHLAHQVIGAAIEVHRQLGPGFLESVYEDALCIELGLRDIPHERQYPVHVLYKGHAVGEGRIDILVDGCLIIELKVVEKLSPVHKAQVISYIKATQLELGLLINFNESVLKAGIKRVILTT